MRGEYIDLEQGVPKQGENVSKLWSSEIQILYIRCIKKFYVKVNLKKQRSMIERLIRVSWILNQDENLGKN